MSNNLDYSIDRFDFQPGFTTLPEKKIAQYPMRKRENSKLMVYYRKDKRTIHTRFNNLGKFLKSGDILVINTSRVYKARLYGKKAGSGGKVEILLLNRIDKRRWCSLIKASKKPGLKQKVIISAGNFEMEAVVLDKNSDGSYVVEFNKFVDYELLEKIGHIPLPPYIKREDQKLDEKFYQTIYSKDPGSIAAPTAGLHFSIKQMEKLKRQCIIFAPVSLDISWDTFRPVRLKDIRAHRMHSEHFSIPKETEVIINNRRDRVIAVGTTAVRVLETVVNRNRKIKAVSGETDLYIYPGYSFRMADGIITNFHLPRSTLFIMISAFTGTEVLKSLYNDAIKRKYRFFSYGDSMLIL